MSGVMVSVLVSHSEDTDLSPYHFHEICHFVNVLLYYEATNNLLH